jgi:DNA-binding XRE family transcriptional regulator
MYSIQVIDKDGVPAFVVLPIELWERVRESVEDAEDIAELERFDREDDGTRVPIEVVRATLQDGRHPVRAWREYRAMTQEQLATAARISVPYLSQIEAGKRVGTVVTLRAIARAMSVSVDMLVPESSAQ